MRCRSGPFLAEPIACRPSIPSQNVRSAPVWLTGSGWQCGPGVFRTAPFGQPGGDVVPENAFGAKLIGALIRYRKKYEILIFF
jgi:hypothetical protein